MRGILPPARVSLCHQDECYNATAMRGFVYSATAMRGKSANWLSTLSL